VQQQQQEQQTLCPTLAVCSLGCWQHLISCGHSRSVQLPCAHVCWPAAIGVMLSFHSACSLRACNTCMLHPCTPHVLLADTLHISWQFSCDTLMCCWHCHFCPSLQHTARWCHHGCCCCCCCCAGVFRCGPHAQQGLRSHGHQAAQRPDPAALQSTAAAGAFDSATVKLPPSAQSSSCARF
jgi:hypothetical protein